MAARRAGPGARPDRSGRLTRPTPDRSELDEHKRTDQILDAERVLHERGDHIVLAFDDMIDAHSVDLVDLEPSRE